MKISAKNNAPLLQVDIGPERIVMTDGLQPFGFKTRSGSIVVQAQLAYPPGQRPERDVFPGLPGTVVSRDGGKTWRRWQPATEQGLGPMIEGAVTTLRDGTTVLLEWLASTPDENGKRTARLWASSDDFETLQGPSLCAVDLPQAVTGFDDGGLPYSGVTFHRTLLELPHGDLLATLYCWFESDDTPCPYMPSMKKMRTVLLRSTNRGESWRYLSTVAVDPAVGEEGFCEPVMVRLSQGEYSGRLVCIMRTGSIDYPLYQAHSDDDGASWSQPRELEMRGVDPNLIEMQDGTLVCSYGRRMNGQHEEKRYYLAFSKDGGETWPQIIAMPPTEPHAQTIPLSETGEWYYGDTTHYSTILEMQPGTLLLLYDVGTWNQCVRYTASREIQIHL
ncbi:MAG: sialidase family protein [Abditibacteriaceae bacterium]